MPRAILTIEDAVDTDGHPTVNLVCASEPIEFNPLSPAHRLAMTINLNLRELIKAAAGDEDDKVKAQAEEPLL